MRSFGLSVTTLEEVFLKIASEDALRTSSEAIPLDSTLESLPATPALTPPNQSAPSPSLWTSLGPAVASPLDTEVQLQLNTLQLNPQLLSPSLTVSFTEQRRPSVADPLNCPRRKGCGWWWCQFRASIVKHVRTVMREPWAAATQVRLLIFPKTFVNTIMVPLDHRCSSLTCVNSMKCPLSLAV